MSGYSEAEDLTEKQLELIRAEQPRGKRKVDPIVGERGQSRRLKARSGTRPRGEKELRYKGGQATVSGITSV